MSTCRQVLCVEIAEKRPRGAPKKRWKHKNSTSQKKTPEIALFGVVEPIQRTLGQSGTHAKQKKKIVMMKLKRYWIIEISDIRS
ncbi:hypothetical protein ANCCAN_23902 [Ancylostoma caninum]|uniref:Uncharacterized protein n=1 Tax=Ancylostoma caninum TaxID=29170 RepID=A0A368FDS3_ANCCA|nr:hypothetical protein ANCCAN_23902 [Ancylostoma caninum]